MFVREIVVGRFQADASSGVSDEAVGRSPKVRKFDSHDPKCRVGQFLHEQ